MALPVRRVLWSGRPRPAPAGRALPAAPTEVAIRLRLLSGVWMTAVVAVGLELWLRSPSAEDDPAIAAVATWGAGVAAALWLLSRASRHWRDRRVLHVGLAPAVPTVFAGILLARTLVASNLDLWIAILAASSFSGWTLVAYLLSTTGLLWAAVSLQHFATGRALAVFITLMIWGAAGLVRWQRLRLEALAALDPLTGLANRLAFEQDGAAELARARRDRQPLVLAVLDLDDFKRVNDSEGHAAGDRLLQQLALLWRADLEERGLLARLGGDEFVVLLPGLGVDEAGAVVRGLRAASPASFSAGLVAFDAEADADLTGLLRRADRALYEAKRCGKGHAALVDAPGRPVRAEGLEPSPPKGPGPKPGASSGSATPAPDRPGLAPVLGIGQATE